MASPQIENGYTKIANEIIEVFCLFRIPGEVRQVIDAIIRKTYGFNKKEDRISNSQIIKMTGLKKGNVSRSLSETITHKIVIKSDNKLRLNKNYDEWIFFGNRKLSKMKPKLSETITRVIRNDNKKLSEVRDTKERKKLLKETIQKKETIYKILSPKKRQENLKRLEDMKRAVWRT